MNLVLALHARAERDPDGLALRYLETGDVGGPELVWTMAELHERAASIGFHLRDRGAAGQPVLLVYPPGADFVAGFLGCLYAGAYPVPVYPPNPGDLQRAVARIGAVARDCGASVLLTTAMVEQFAATFGERLAELSRFEWISTDTLPVDGGGWSPPELADPDIAFLQYTSGSTGTPKGVIVRHGELAFNVRACRDALGWSRHCVTWLPAYHDMGLIGTLLSPLYHGVPVTFMAPQAFLMKPSRWMTAISHFGADITAGPNFGYHLAARKTRPEELEGLDLSGLDIAVIGAEPVSPTMIEHVLSTFGRAGLRAEALYPAYGMAEATLIISTNGVGEAPMLASFDRAALEQGEARPPEGAGVAMVGCGVSIPGQSIVIADPDTRAPLVDGRVGEILVAGPSVAGGYWGHEESVEDVFAVEVPDRTERYLRTGDLGFFAGGQLFISGRIKDLIIVRGRNFAPADIESTVENAAPDVFRPGRVVAVAVEDEDGEVPVILAETRGELSYDDGVQLARAAARAVAEAHGISPGAVALLSKGAIPLTSSGKVRRRAARAMYLDGSLEQYLRVAMSGPEGSPAPVYGSLDFIRAELDTRATDYLFDLERDLPWDQADAPGCYLPTSLLSLFGIDTERLARSREVFETFQWAAALSICRTFELLEWGIIQFARMESGTLGETRSIENLCVEEEKHIRLFRRLATQLAARRPELAEAFDRAFAPGYTFLRGLFEGTSDAELHYRIWLTTLLFEPATLHLWDELDAAPEPVQPLWKKAHELHAREELQHVATVTGYMQALELDPEVRARVDAEFLAAVERGLLTLYGLEAPLALVRERWPELGLVESTPGIPEPFFDELMRSPSFRSFRRAVKGLRDALIPVETPEPARPEVVLVLSSERSGSTLLRVMLSAHGEVFSPPEMNLANYPTLGERRERLPEPQQVGLVTALAALHGDFDLATRTVAGWQDDDTETAEAYRHILAQLDGRVLVDKSPMYSRDIEGLRRAEAMFGDRVRYVFLTRHPHAVVDSYVRVGLERLVAGRLPEGADAHGMGEMGWTLSNRTIQEFLTFVDPSRHTTIRFEDLVTDPTGEMVRLSAFLGLEFDERVLDPYEYGEMMGTTGAHAAVGDPNFQDHRGIDPALANAWKRVTLPRPLGAEARRVAESLGYTFERRSSPRPAVTPALVEAERGAVRATVLGTVAAAVGLPAAELSDDTRFAELGLDSLGLIQLTNDLEARLGVPLAAMTLYDHPTVGRLVGHLSNAATPEGTPVARVRPRMGRRTGPVVAASARDLAAEVTLDESVRADGREPAERPPQSILLTGATGFLGAWLLRELLDRCDATIHCLVRAADADAGKRRLQDNMARYGIADEELPARVVALPGDLAAPRFGLPEAVFEALGRHLDTIYHNGALLRFGQGYSSLAPANVGGTREILRLATTGALKTVHHVSSMSVFDTFDNWDGEVDEQTDMTPWQGIRLGYAQTKWVAERLVALAGERGVPVNIFRCAGIAGDSRTGAWNTEDLICRMIRGCASMGSAPRLSFELDMAPVDYVARGLVTLSLERTPGGVYHLNSPAPITWKRFIGWMQFQGFEIELRDYKPWVDDLNLVARRVDHPLASLMPLFAVPLPPDDLSQIETRQHRPHVRCEATAAALAEHGVTCPAIDHALLTTWFSRFDAEGFLRAP